MKAEMGTCSRCGHTKRLTPDGLIYLHDNCKGSRKPSREMLEKKVFDDLLESQKAEPVNVESLWDGVKALWGPLHGDEGVLVKGIIMLECVDPDGDPNFMWLASPGMSDWAIKGFLAQANEDLTQDSLIQTMFTAIANAQQVNENEDEDEED